MLYLAESSTKYAIRTQYNLSTVSKKIKNKILALEKFVFCGDLHKQQGSFLVKFVNYFQLKKDFEALETRHVLRRASQTTSMIVPRLRLYRLPVVAIAMDRKLLQVVNSVAAGLHLGTTGSSVAY